MLLQSWLEQLNPEQKAAVTWAEGGSLLVLAGAGSGKTRVLTTRLAWLHAHGVEISRLMAVTFTKKASQEMLARVRSMMDVPPHRLWLGTFHALCVRMLRDHHVAANLPKNFQILDRDEQGSLIRQCMQDLQMSFPSAAEVRDFVRRSIAWIDAQKEKALRPHHLATQRLAEKDVWFWKIYQDYQARCDQHGVVDFAEILLRCVELLREHEDICRNYQDYFAEILVDEFQDTNALQYEWLKLLCGGGARLFAVGDDDQSIYAFRGAKVENMQAMLRDFAVEAPVRLEQNYRSTPEILAAANAVIAKNSQRFDKQLRTNQASGAPIMVIENADGEDEVHAVVHWVRQQLAAGADLGNMAVLYRSGAQSRLFEQGFLQNNLPFVLRGTRFFERQEIKYAMAYLSLLDNFDHDLALARVINFPPRGIGDKTLEQLDVLARELGGSLWDAAQRIEGAAAKKCRAFCEMLQNLSAGKSQLTLSQWLRLVLQTSGMFAHFEQKREGERLENLGELLSAAQNFEQDFRATQALGDDEVLLANQLLPHFLEWATLDAEVQDEVPAAIHLMTVHAAKGLEFDYVFVVGLEDGLFPSFRSLGNEGLQEERRLMYVAMTRARRQLYLSYAQERMHAGKIYRNKASRFLEELGEANVEFWGCAHGVVRKKSKFCPPETIKNKLLTKTSIKKIYNSQAPADKNRATQPDFDAIATAPQNIAWRIGMRVLHPKFGRGIVTNFNPQNWRMDVQFETVGAKCLDLNFAKLAPMD